ncbi:hypothetical protein ACLB1G_06175 [Oxalobacteraceae bacterium A2-2]
MHDTYTRQQGAGRTYDIEYSGLRYRIELDGKLLKEISLPLEHAAHGSEAAWRSAVADIEYLRGMPES